MRFKTRLKINFERLKRNVARVREISGSCQILFMVKANAYGHGMVPVVSYAASHLGITDFGCATIGEALTLRRELADLDFNIYVFSDLEFSVENGFKNYVENRIIPVLSCLEDVTAFLEESSCQFVPLCLKIDTGMNRLGIKNSQIQEVMALLKARGRLKIHHLMSHFACASHSISKNPKNKKQYEEFQQLKKVFENEGFLLERTSMANSGAIEQGYALKETHVRPGLILYGPSSLSQGIREKSLWTGENISSLETHIIQLHQLKKGDPVGYGAIPCPKDGWVAYIGMGYGDGITNFYGGLKIIHKGMEGIFIGRISMDMAAVLFPPEAGDLLSLGEGLTLWDHDPGSVLSISDQVSTIPYEIFCCLGDRVPRVYSLS